VSFVDKRFKELAAAVAAALKGGKRGWRPPAGPAEERCGLMMAFTVPRCFAQPFVEVC